MTAKQLRDWKIYYELEPWGYAENDLQLSYLRKVVAQSFTSKKDKSPFTISEFSIAAMREDAEKEEYKKKHRKGGKMNVEAIKDHFLSLEKRQKKKNAGKDKPPRIKRGKVNK